jgi:cysteine desulfurase
VDRVGDERPGGAAPARAYLDWAAGAPLHPAARAALLEAVAAPPGNPASVHAEGRAARARLEAARARVARLCEASGREVVFTGSGTEANALAIRGREGPVLAAAVEHPSVLLAGRRDRRLVELPCDAAGRLRLDALEAALPGAGLLCVQAANNETGVIQPVAEAAALARSAGVPVHVDAVQAAGKLDLAPLWDRCDSLSVSAHKLGGTPGAAALFLRRAVELSPVIPGHQEKGRRGGTPGLLAIAAFGAVAEAVLAEREARAERLAAASGRLEALLAGADPAVVIHGAGAPRVPGIVSAAFPGADGETLLVALDLAGVAASHGAACASGALEPSHVLRAMGVPPELARATVRFSLGPETTEAELALLAAALPGALAAARAAAAAPRR